MTFFSKIFPVRHSIAVYCLAAMLPLGAALSGCGEAPKIPDAPKSSAAGKSDGAPMGSPAPSEDKDAGKAAGGYGVPPENVPQTDNDELGNSGSPPPNEEAAKAKPDDAVRAAEAARHRALQEEEAKLRELQSNKYGEVAANPKKATPPPPVASTAPPVVERDNDELQRETRAREEKFKRELKEMRAPDGDGTQYQMTDRERQQKQAGNKDDDKSEGSGSGGGSIGSAQPPPPAPAPSTAGQPGGGRSSDNDEIAPSRGLEPPAKPPVTLAEKDKAFDVVPVFYGTDRSVEPDAKRLQFGTERGHKLQIGRALVTVPTAHKVPNIERPWVVELPYFKYKIYEETEDPSQHFTIQEIAALTKEQLLAHVKERLAKSKTFKDHAFVFVHGFNTSFDTAIYRTAQIAYDLKFDGAPFVYSWPSGGKVASYTYDRGSAEQAEPQLAEYLDMVVKESGAKSISLIAHSMGNELLLRVIERMKTTAPKGVVISQVILAAPDVDRDKFTNIAREITNFAQGVTLYAASNDRALGYSARFWGGVPRAGDVPASGPLIIPGVDTIDVTAVSTDSLGLNHSGYAENPTLLKDIALLLQKGVRPPDKRTPSLQKVSGAGGSFWRYPPVPPAPH